MSGEEYLCQILSLSLLAKQPALFQPEPSILEDSTRFDPVFSPLDFATTFVFFLFFLFYFIFFFFTEWGRHSCVQPPTWRTRTL
jgi:hypothetical protein